MPPEEAARAVARAWHDKAAGDLAAARACLAAAVPAWVAAFHLQQAVEKSLKGLLVLAGCEPPRLHSLVRLDALLRQAGAPAPLTLDELELLQPFAVEDRYPALFAPALGRDDVVSYVAPAERAVVILADALRARATAAT